MWAIRRRTALRAAATGLLLTVAPAAAQYFPDYAVAFDGCVDVLFTQTRSSFGNLDQVADAIQAEVQAFVCGEDAGSTSAQVAQRIATEAANSIAVIASPCYEFGEPLFDFGGESPALAAADEVARLLRTGAARLPDDVCGGCPLALQILAASFEGTLMSATEGAESVLTNGGSDGLPTDAELDEFTAQLLGAISSGLTDLLDEMKQAASTCDGVAIFGIAGEVTGVPCAVDLELSASAPVVRGVTERAASAISAFACDDDDAPDDIDSPVESVAIAVARGISEAGATCVARTINVRPCIYTTDDITTIATDVAERFATRYNGLVFFCTPRPCTSRRAAFAAAILAIVQPAAQQAVDEQCQTGDALDIPEAQERLIELATPTLSDLIDRVLVIGGECDLDISGSPPPPSPPPAAVAPAPSPAPTSPAPTATPPTSPAPMPPAPMSPPPMATPPMSPAPMSPPPTATPPMSPAPMSPPPTATPQMSTPPTAAPPTSPAPTSPAPTSPPPTPAATPSPSDPPAVGPAEAVDPPATPPADDAPVGPADDAPVGPADDAPVGPADVGAAAGPPPAADFLAPEFEEPLPVPEDGEAPAQPAQPSITTDPPASTAPPQSP